MDHAGAGGRDAGAPPAAAAQPLPAAEAEGSKKSHYTQASVLSMTDPVIISSGHTFDREVITEWFQLGNITCPRSDERLQDLQLIPNLAVRDIIRQICLKLGRPCTLVPLPESIQDGEVKSAVHDDEVESAAGPPKYAYWCPICQQKMIEPYATHCGHVFCKTCIWRHLKRSKMCAGCRQLTETRMLHKVFLPKVELE